MSRTRKFLMNTITTAMYQFFVMIAGFIIPRILLVHYGSEINGLVSSITQFIAYFSLVEAGLSGAAIYALYKPLSSNNYSKINGILSATKIFYNKSGYIFLSLTIGLSVFYPLFVKTNSLTAFHVGILVLILGFNGVLEFFTLSKYRVLLTADQKTYVISIASLVQIVINVLIILVLSRLKVDILFLRFVALFSILLRSFILYIYTKLKYGFVNYKETPDFNSLHKRWDALYLQILGAIHNGAPVLILTAITKDLNIVSVYTVFQMVLGAINAILSIFLSGLAAAFGDLLAKDEVNKLQIAYNEFEFVYYNLITVVYAVSFVTIMPFIDLYTNGITDIEYYYPQIGFLFVLNGLFYNIKTPQGMMVISSGLFKETKNQTTIQGLIAVILGVILTLKLGIVGVLLASIIANIYRDIDLLFYIPRNVTRLSIKTSGLRLLKMFLCIFLILFTVSMTQVGVRTVGGYFIWFVMVIKIGSFSIILVTIVNILVDMKNMSNVVKRLLRMVKK